MNPQEFSWSEDQQVTVINPTEQPYKFKVHNKEYVLNPHKSAKMPGYIAWVYVYGLSTQLCQAAGEFMRWNEEGFRQTYYEKLVKNVDAVVQDIEEVAEPALNTFDEEDVTAVNPGNTPSAETVANNLAAQEEDQEPESEPEQPREPETPIPDEETETPAPSQKELSKVQPMKAKAKQTVSSTS